MFTLPAALMVEEFADTSAVELKAAIDAALSQLPARRNHEICLCVAGWKFPEAAATLDEYNGTEKVLKKITSILGETIKHGGTGKPIAAGVGMPGYDVVFSTSETAPAHPKTTDYPLPEMPTRPVAPTPSPVVRAMSEVSAEQEEALPQLASSGSGERRTRKRA